MAQPAITKFLQVHRKKFLVTLYERRGDDLKFQVAQEHPCAVGARGYGTEEGLYLIEAKAKNPEWMVPNSPWAIEMGLTPGTVIEGGVEENPIRERWLQIGDGDGIGIHGTNAFWSIGTRASHGCIRMLPKDVIELYDEVPLNTPIIIL